MKILLDARLYGLEHSGIGRYLIHLVAELSKLDKKNKYQILLRKKYFNLLKLPSNWKKVYAEFGIYGVKEQLNLPKVIKDLKPDLIHFPHFNVPIFYGGRYIVTLHDMTMHKQGINATKQNPVSYFFKKYAYKLVYFFAVKRAFKIITPSESVKSEIRSYFRVNREKLEVTYEGFDPKTWNGKHPLDVLLGEELNGVRYFIYVGNLYPHKNVKSVISALKILNTNYGRNIHLVIVGAKDVFMSKLMEFIRQNGMEKMVHIMGFVKDEDTSTLMKNAVSFVYPSLSEGFGLQGLEAMSSGTLVLASDLPIFREIYSDNALYFDPTSPKDIVDKMRKTLVISEEQRAGKIAKAREFIRKYSWQKMAKDTLKIYLSAR